MTRDTTTRSTAPLFGLLAEFSEPEQVIEAARKATAEGYRRTEAYSPYPVEELADALEFRKTRLPALVLLGGLLGAAGGYGLQYWASVIHYPMNIGGRPLHSWPLFMPVTFECTILAASLFCVLGMLALNGLPRPHHPLFDVEGFEHASSDRFYLLILARDPRFDPESTRRFLEELQPGKISDVYQ